MNAKYRALLSRLTRVICKPGFWLILVLIALITLPHYEETFRHPAFLTQLTANLGLDRHAFERIVYLAPIVWAGFLFGFRGAFITSLVALACMLPRAIFISPSPLDALFETSAVFVIGNILAISFNALRKEREQRTQLEAAHQELSESEQRYRILFENAHDAIWVQDMEGNILTANEASARLTGYDIEALSHMRVTDFLSEEGLELARDVRRRLLQGEVITGPYDQRMTRKNGTEALIRLSSSLIRDDGEPVAFQHIARDITEERRMHDNLRYYLQQVTRAQEEERKRISRELHDESVQALVVLSRQLDALASNDKGLSEDNRARLEELRQQTNNVMQGIRRLSQDLRPAVLDSLGLLATLEWLASDVTEYSGIKTKVNIHGKERRLPEEVELVLFRITQEALRNMWRHSQATSAEITVEFDESKIKITVSDNGKGFALPKTMGDLARDGKLGLAGMEERARLVGGTLTAKSQPGKGASITIELPA
jgi:PAS domain S-box-containing protein